MAKKVSSIKIEENIWIKVKKHCIDNNITITDYFTELVQKDLKNEDNGGDDGDRDE